jgi:hypothetical protein
MNEPNKSIAPEVEHLLAAVKAVKRGLIPEKSTVPQHEPDEIDQEQEYEQEEATR